MSNKILFIGGSADGRRIETAELDRYYQGLVPGGGTDEYRRERFRSRSGEVFVYIFSGMTTLQAFERLLDFYVAPQKPAREDSIRRANGNVMCSHCGRTYSEHLCLNQLCDGTFVKL